jgi:hypothetical protein
MKKYITLAITFFCIFNVAFAQKNNFKYGVVGQMGLLNGAAGESLSIQVINGVSKDKWFVGAGVGLDYYNYRSVPVFVDVRRDLTSKKNTPFVYIDGGLNFQWLREDEKNMKGSPTKYQTGTYYDAGLGWKLKGKNDRAFLASVGYNYKQSKETVTNGRFWPLPTQLNETTDYYISNFKRIVIRIGFQL